VLTMQMMHPTIATMQFLKALELISGVNPS
jgi:hypothetical protein